MRAAVVGVLLAVLAATQIAVAAAPPASPRPEARSSEEGSGALADSQAAGATLLSPRPAVRPANLVRRATVRAAGFTPAPVAPSPSGGRKPLCGVPGLAGESVRAIPARIAGCGLSNGVKVTSVRGVALSNPAVMDCATAQALDKWVGSGVLPVIGNRGGGVVQLRVAAHYACRTRNNQPGGRVSEHGRGRAIDISGFALRNGTRIDVLSGWNDRRQGPLLRKMHGAACGPFGTVLGPNSDRYHRDHFHFDTARYRSGPYCR
jgi:hypothetical protein